MNNEAMEMVAMSIKRARKIVATPSLFSGREIIIACKLLFACGNAKDMQAVMALQKLGIVAGFEPARSPRLRIPKRCMQQWAAVRPAYIVLAAALTAAVLLALVITITSD